MTHTEYLKALFDKMLEAGFANICIDDEDLEPLNVETHGAEAVIDEMLQLDGGVQLTAEWPRHSGDTTPYDEPYRMALLFILCNDPEESLADYTIPVDSASEAIDAICDSLLDELN